MSWGGSHLLQAQRLSTSVVRHFETPEAACQAAQMVNRKPSDRSVVRCGFVLVQNRDLDVYFVSVKTMLHSEGTSTDQSPSSHTQAYRSGREFRQIQDFYLVFEKGFQNGTVVDLEG